MMKQNDRIYFVVSDLHGQDEIYTRIIEYLENVQLETEKKVTLIILGDVIDRGPNSLGILLDIIDRVNDKKGTIDIMMSAGNHEMMMLDAINFYKRNGHWNTSPIKIFSSNIWFHPSNGGLETLKEYTSLDKTNREEIYNFLKKLPIYLLIDTFDTPYVLVHASPPKIMLKKLENITLGDITTSIKYRPLEYCLTYRKESQRERISLSNAITIVGHTPVKTDKGYKLEESKHLISIDGGCAYMNFDIDLPQMATLVKLPFEGESSIVRFYKKEKTLKKAQTPCK